MRFVVVEARGAPLPAPVEEYLARGDVDELPFTPAAHTRWSDRSASVHLACWEPAGSSAVEVGPSGVVAVAGNPRLRRESWPAASTIASEIQCRSRRPGWVHADELCDSYAFVRIDDDGDGLVAMDPLGLHPIYVHRTDRLTVVANRADLVAEVAALDRGAPLSRDGRCGAWLAFAGYVVGDRSGFENVEVLGESSWVRSEAGRLRIESGPRLWQGDPDEATRDWEDVASELEADVAQALRHAIERSPNRPALELTGGKDSRLILAIALRAGLAEQFELITWGPASLPDQQVAAEIAPKVGLDHRPVLLQDPPTRPLVERFRSHVHRTAGASNCYDYGDLGDQSRLVISGFFGECFRTASDQAASDPPCSWDVAGDRFRHRHFGRARLVASGVEAELWDAALSYYLEPRHLARSPSDARSIFYFRCHVARWLGPMVDSMQHRLQPLYSPVAIRGAFAMGSLARDHERIHRHLITQASPDLAALPFANGAWRGELHPTPVRGAANAAQANRPRRATERARAAAALIEADLDNPMFELLDRDALRRVAASLPEHGPRTQQQLLGAVTALIWQTHTELPSRGPSR